MHCPWPSSLALQSMVTTLGPVEGEEREQLVPAFVQGLPHYSVQAGATPQKSSRLRSHPE